MNDCSAERDGYNVNPAAALRFYGTRRFRLAGLPTLRLTVPLLLALLFVFDLPAADRAPGDAAARAPMDLAVASPGSPEKGWDFLRNRAYLPPDFDQEDFDDLWRMWSASDQKSVAKLSLAERRRAIAEHYGLVLDPDTPADEFRLLGYVKTEGGWAMNCLACHGGVLNGTPVPGLGNNRIALQTLTEDVRKIKLLRLKKLGHMDLAILKLPLNVTNGTTNSVIFGVVLGALRNPDMTVDKNRPVPSLMHHDMDAPPWWRLPKKSRLYADGFAPKNHRTIMQFMMLPRHDREVFTGWEDDFRHILAWMETVTPPRYPKPIDTALVARGRQVFEQRCADCHGTYGEGGRYPEKVVSIDLVGTDRARFDSLTKEHREWMKVGWLSFFGRDLVETEPAGYLAPPLDGIWASAPYLHNGSVPTLEHLLNSSTRPKVWRQTGTAVDYDRGGLAVETLDKVPEKLGEQERRWYFDTGLFGKSSAGHTFGDDLSGDERRALLEYLKSI